MVRKSAEPAALPQSPTPEPISGGLRPRGRPKAYDAGHALEQARDAFWDSGFNGTSLDDLTAATGMNKPSLYGAFGDKHTLYLQTLARYRELGRNAMREELASHPGLAQALRAIYARAIAIYTTGQRGARGCYLIGTAATEAVNDLAVREAFAAGLHELDDLLAARLRDAVESGELVTAIEPATLARVLCGVMNSLALRARAGESTAQLEAMAEGAVQLVLP
ncbi:AcrR family transcriptional regulator [Silvimonas terrae]|uniref:AcrR family transcriptional regulator n=1 Tax=Silvimonas terrae TaxID=300266 RepID=A0A840RFL2_9NEIS|nr:TetR/AcrR family transcriptional regulator [Silvimonas terrae]MBB5191156.1 AcrR family transcriptional regulator [Silvimonas terrae]